MVFFADRIQRELEADFSFANVLEIDNNRLTGKIIGSIINSEKKTELMKRLGARKGKSATRVVAVGDGNNDIGMISESAVGVSFKGSNQLNISAKHILQNSDLSAILYLLGTKRRTVCALETIFGEIKIVKKKRRISYFIFSIGRREDKHCSSLG